MKRLPVQITWAALAVLAVTGCASMSSEDLGTVIGAGVGAAVGAEVAGDDNKTLGAVAGAVLGGLVGRKVGGYMDDRDRKHTAAALEHNASGEASSWTNPSTGHGYSVTPTSSFTNDAGAPCRHFTIVQSPGSAGQGEQVASTACRKADGVWVTG